MNAANILIVEDEPGLILTLQDRFENEGYNVDVADDGEKGFQKASFGGYDVIILDLMLPKKSGLDVCRDLRAKDVFTPILMLTAKGQVIDKVLGLKMGADDYLAKPFEFMELLARIEALIRRNKRVKPAKKSDSTFSFSDVEVFISKGEVHKSGDAVTLSAKEFHLLHFMLQHQGELLTRERLLDEVWGYDSTPTTRTVDVHVAWLRQKLEDDHRHPKHIMTVHGMGYKFVL
ncbi:response regulator transcription factor [bacterium]|nr:MAG: response regulator transcription factor [bacterium]